MNQLVRFLFGHEQAVFTNGRFGFDVRPGALLLVLIFFSPPSSSISSTCGHAFAFQNELPPHSLPSAPHCLLLMVLAVAAGGRGVVSDSAQQLCRDGH